MVSFVARYVRKEGKQGDRFVILADPWMQVVDTQASSLRYEISRMKIEAASKKECLTAARKQCEMEETPERERVVVSMSREALNHKMKGGGRQRGEMAVAVGRGRGRKGGDVEPRPGWRMEGDKG